MSRSLRVIAAALLATALTTALGATAQAAPAPRHCVAEVGTATRAPGAPTCFATFPEAISFATHGTVKLAAGATTVSQSQLRAGYRTSKAALASYVIGISYWNTGYSGATYTHTAGSGCDHNIDIDFYMQFPTSWNDKA